MNGKKYQLDSKPFIKNGRTMISISNIVKVSGVKEGSDIRWEGETQTVTIKKQLTVPTEKEVAVYSEPKEVRKEHSTQVRETETPFDQVQVLHSQLRETIEEAKNLDSNLHPQPFMDKLNHEISAGERELANPSGTEGLKEAISAIRIAMNSTDIPPIPPTPPTEESEVRKELRGLVQEGKAIDKSRYTTASVQALENAILKGEASLNDPTQDDHTVDISVEIMKLALINLVRKEDEGTKEITVTEPHGLLNSNFAFAYLVGHDNENTTGLKIFVDGNELPMNSNPNFPGFYVYRNLFTARNEILLTAATFKEVGEYKIKITANGYATKEFTLEMERFAPRMNLKYTTITPGVDLVVDWGRGNPEGLENRYLTDDLIVKVNGKKANFYISSHKQDMKIFKNNFPTEGVYNITFQREGFEDNEFTLNVSQLENVDIISSATTNFNVKKEYKVGDYVNYRYVKTNATFTDKTSTTIEILYFKDWGIEITPVDGYVFKESDIGDFPFIITKNGVEIGRKNALIKKKE